MIPLERLELMFANIRRDTPWDMGGPMLWGYFFFDPAAGSLEALAGRLEADGYRVVGVGLTDDRQAYRLHVEKVEVHSPESLYARNAELGRLAEEYGVETYDGMDVGPVAGAAVVAQPKEPLVTEKKGLLRRLFG